MSDSLVSLRVVRISQTPSITGDCVSGYYAKASKGLAVPPFKTGLRASAVFEHEVQMIAAARAAGQSDDEIRMLVTQLIAERPKYFDQLMAAAGLDMSASVISSPEQPA